jgi:hypothetical protein
MCSLLVNYFESFESLARIIHEAAEEWFCWQRDWSEDGCGRMRVLGLRRRRACSTAQWLRRGFRAQLFLIRSLRDGGK